MINCYKNFPVKINYSNGSDDVIYGNSTSLSESIELEHAESIGVKGSNAVFSNSVPKGDLNVDSYLIDDLGIYNNLKGSNDQGITIDFGPYHCPAPCVMSSMSISISVGEPITISRTFNYFGSVTKLTSPTPQNPELHPVVADNITLSGFDGLGGAENITSITWDFTQNYNEHFLLGNPTPIISFGRGEISMNIDGEGLTDPLVSSNCIVPAKNYGIIVSGCSGDSLGQLNISGHMQSRNSNVSSESNEQNSLSIIQYL